MNLFQGGTAGRLPFRDRTEAGRRLAERLMEYRGQPVTVVALPRGGVTVGFEVARALDAPLDVLVARKLGAPGHEELGIGAIAPGGVRILDTQAVRWLGITDEQLDAVTEQETREMHRRLHRFRGDRPPLDVHDRTVILVDDGLATGVTARAALESLRRQNPPCLVLAVPVCAPDTANAMRGLVDDLVCLATPPQFRAVGYWYNNFDQVSDEEVIALLTRAAQPDGAGQPSFGRE